METVARTFALPAVIGVLGLASAAAAAGASAAPEPTVEVQSSAGLAPDARSISVQVMAHDRSVGRSWRLSSPSRNREHQDSRGSR
jgi:hypothetical protein